MHVRLLATSDVHMNLSGFSETHGHPTPQAGLARLGQVIEDERRSAPGLVLLVDNGDILQGTPLAITAKDMPGDSKHPFVLSMSQLRYDAIGLGNHDFDFGEDYVERLARALPFPTLTSNVKGLKHVRPRVILERHVEDDNGESLLIKIGLTSALPIQTANWCAHSLGPGISVSDPLTALEEQVRMLRQEGADIIVVLAHGGLEAVPEPHGSESFAHAVASIPGVTALVAGHSHLLFPDPRGDCDGHVAECPVVQPGFRASHLGCIDLTFDVTEHFALASSQTRLVPLEGQDPLPQILDGLRPARAETKRRMSQPIGRTRHHMHSYFSMLRPDTCTSFVADTMIDALDQLDLPDSWSDLPRLAAVSPGLSGGRSGPDFFVSIPPGEVPLGAIESLCPFENVLTAKRMRGADLRLWMERAAAIYVDPAETEAQLLQPEMPVSFFDTFRGLQVELDPNRPARFAADGTEIAASASRVLNLSYKGDPVGPADEFLVAMYSFRAMGGGRYPDVGDALPAGTDGPKVRDLLRTAFSQTEEVVPEPLDWHLRLGSGREVYYDTSPLAVDHLDEIAEFQPDIFSVTPEGFLRLKLRL